MGFMAFVLLSRMALRPAIARLIPLFSCIPPIAGSLLGALTHFIPSLTPVLSHIYSGPDIDYAREGVGSSGDELNRFTTLTVGAKAGILTLLSYFPPLSLFSPARLFRFLCFLAVCTGFAFAGFRTYILFMCFAFVIAAYFRNGIKERPSRYLRGRLHWRQPVQSLVSERRRHGGIRLHGGIRDNSP
jgi:hypothetical protein